MKNIQHIFGQLCLGLFLLVGFLCTVDIATLFALKLTGRDVIVETRNDTRRASFQRSDDLRGLDFTPYRIWVPKGTERAPLFAERPELGPWRKTAHACQSPLAKEIWFFGASPIFDREAEWNETVPSQLAGLLKSEGCYRVHNFGSPGYVHMQEFLLFAELLKTGRRPALAIFMSGATDTTVGSIVGAPLAGHYWQEDLETQMTRTKKTRVQILGDALYEMLGETPSFQLFSRLVKKTQTPKGRVVTNVAEWPKQVVSRFRETSRLIHRLGESHGVPTKVYWQPDEVLWRHIKSEKRRVRHDVYLEAERQSPNSDFIYLGRMFPEAGTFLRDGPHLLPDGRRALARRLAQDIKDLYPANLARGIPSDPSSKLGMSGDGSLSRSSSAS